MRNVYHFLKRRKYKGSLRKCKFHHKITEKMQFSSIFGSKLANITKKSQKKHKIHQKIYKICEKIKKKRNSSEICGKKLISSKDCWENANFIKGSLMKQILSKNKKNAKFSKKLQKMWNPSKGCSENTKSAKGSWGGKTTPIFLPKDHW